jgi:hypothetical protein
MNGGKGMSRIIHAKSFSNDSQNLLANLWALTTTSVRMLPSTLMICADQSADMVLEEVTEMYAYLIVMFDSSERS